LGVTQLPREKEGWVSILCCTLFCWFSILR